MKRYLYLEISLKLLGRLHWIMQLLTLKHTRISSAKNKFKKVPERYEL